MVVCRSTAAATCDKERIALDIASRNGIKEGLICIFRTVAPCMTYPLHRNRQNKTLDLELFQGRCLHLYHYWYDEYFGFMGARLQTWFPFAMQIQGERENTGGRRPAVIRCLFLFALLENLC